MRTPLQKGEKVLLVTYSSWTTLIAPVLIALLGLAAAVLIVIKAGTAWGWLAAVLGIGYWFIRYYSWKLNIWVVTNFRVIDESGLLSHYAKESPLDKINNVSYDQSVWGRLFNFGHVEIQTAAEVGATDYFNVQHPKRLKDTITAAQAEHQTWQYGNQAAQMAAALDARTGSGPVPKAANAPQVAAELEKLFELKMKGAITEEEYLRAKERLLNH
ncbi:MAG TPA: PH domain-containing protein [Puia sp.]|uniref:PH domain-containing protein n=1 Tax=Puia sp. TaxID=2045100 RepID=UPI002C0608EB|nr:PH domain-containing protein [Puia sp.]HVU96446.1 PH domain-containing protein [Puia sp.]